MRTAHIKTPFFTVNYEGDSWLLAILVFLVGVALIVGVIFGLAWLLSAILLIFFGKGLSVLACTLPIILWMVMARIIKD